MEVNVETFKRVDLITVSGRIDSSSVSKLEETLNKLFEDGRRNLVIDLSDVHYMSSAGIRALVSAKRSAARGLGGGVRLVNPSERVGEVLDLAGLTSFFDIYEDRAAAVGSF